MTHTMQLQFCITINVVSKGIKFDAVIHVLPTIAITIQGAFNFVGNIMTATTLHNAILSLVVFSLNFLLIFVTLVYQELYLF